jgi:hypothetical protein
MTSALKVALLCLISVTAFASTPHPNIPEEALEPDGPVAARDAANILPRQLGWNMSLRGEVDVLGNGLNLLSAVAPVVGIGYSGERLGGLLGVLVQASPGLRAEGRFQLSPPGGLRPYVGLGTTAFFRERTREGAPTFFSSFSGRGVLGVEVQCTSRLYGFADIAYERFLRRGDLYRSDAVLLSMGVGLFP